MSMFTYNIVNKLVAAYNQQSLNGRIPFFSELLPHFQNIKYHNKIVLQSWNTSNLDLGLIIEVQVNRVHGGGALYIDKKRWFCSRTNLYII